MSPASSREPISGLDSPTATASAPPRLGSIDAYRGFVMLLMMAEVLELGRVAAKFPSSEIWRFLALHQSHVEWKGCSLHDMIQPSFSFLVGVALPFSLASRVRRGQPLGWMIAHAAWRSFVLIALGIFLRSVGRDRTNFTFEDTLTQIGLGYFPLFLLGLASTRIRIIALLVLLGGYWVAFAAYPQPSSNFDWSTAGVPADWEHHAAGLPAHWNKNTNVAWAFDRWFLNLFPRNEPFAHNSGGYATLSFIPTLATMLLGLFAGTWLKEGLPPRRTLALLLLAGTVSLALGWGLDRLGLCPIVKRLWTPSWTLYSGAICFGMLAGFHILVDLAGWSALSLPLRVIGANSIAAYVLAHIGNDFILGSFHTHFGKQIFGLLGEKYEPLLQGAAILLVYWLILLWMYRRKIFLRI
jgi:predicted acyltransferase